jgi:NADH-quinone oxidoreductase subunit L
MFLTFWGKPRWAGSEHIQHAVHDAHGHDAHDAHAHDDHAEAEGAGSDPHAVKIVEGTAGYHPHESPLTMLIPLGVLSIGAIFAGFFFHDQFLGAERGAEFWNNSLAFNAHLMEEMHHVPLFVKLSAGIVMVIGFAIAYWAYIADTSIPKKFTDTFQGLYKFLLNKWYFDELYHVLFVVPAFALGRFFWHRGDEKTIDRFGPNGAAAVVVSGGKLAAKLQSGYLYTYALVMLLGLAAAATWAMTR